MIIIIIIITIITIAIIIIIIIITFFHHGVCPIMLHQISHIIKRLSYTNIIFTISPYFLF